MSVCDPVGADPRAFPIGAAARTAQLAVRRPAAGWATGLPALAKTGNVAVAGAALDLLSGAALDVAGGAVFLGDSVVDSSDATGKFTLRGGSAGGVLRGAGTVRTPVLNAGSVEPGASGRRFANGYTQQPGGCLRINRAAWNAGSRVPVNVAGLATLDGSVYVED